METSRSGFEIKTERLILVAATPELVQAELEGPRVLGRKRVWSFTSS